ncbi:hypothetical protein XU18_0824 [Perkinsela sp. CCAP 1560/4]|nr:hypothetical protein XU18_0824 [Perkinsela sp. CCAP 1560/4]|eukprot:KNH08704.1 hypothetical protein XU18_0824 [Perkinsela sp. CCAP 1560/4]
MNTPGSIWCIPDTKVPPRKNDLSLDSTVDATVKKRDSEGHAPHHAQNTMPRLSGMGLGLMGPEDDFGNHYSASIRTPQSTAEFMGIRSVRHPEKDTIGERPHINPENTPMSRSERVLARNLSKSLVNDARTLSVKARKELESITHRGKPLYQLGMKAASTEPRKSSEHYTMSRDVRGFPFTQFGSPKPTHKESKSRNFLDRAMEYVRKLLHLSDTSDATTKSSTQRSSECHSKPFSTPKRKDLQLDSYQTPPRTLPRKSMKDTLVGVSPESFHKSRGSPASWNLRTLIPRLDIPSKCLNTLETGGRAMSTEIRTHDYTEYFAYHSREENAIYH